MVFIEFDNNIREFINDLGCTVLPFSIGMMIENDHKYTKYQISLKSDPNTSIECKMIYYFLSMRLISEFRIIHSDVITELITNEMTVIQQEINSKLIHNTNFYDSFKKCV